MDDAPIFFYILYMQLTDSYGRTIKSLRISITNRCNLKCIYCHREGQTRYTNNEMNVETIANIVRASKKFGVNKVKFSGGEPLMRHDFENILKALPELKDISATTNGTSLVKRAQDLAGSGLNRINISLPSLRAEKYRKVTGGDVSIVLDGIDAAVASGLIPVKLNMVILKLIELMNFQQTAQYQVNINEVEKFLEKRATDIEERSMHRRRKYHIDGIEVELVRPIDNSHFCANCNRLRVTSDGKLKPCLLRNDNLVDVNNKEPGEIAELMKFAMEKREPFYKDTGEL